MKLPYHINSTTKIITTFLSRQFSLITIFIVVVNLLLGSLPILNGDIHFSSDIARDFLLFEEIDQKKVILIGPRASGLQGLFHGPLWLYLNYPAYIVGNGNPLIVGYYWIALTTLFLGLSYFLTRRLFNHTVANFYVILLSSAMVFFINGLFNPMGVLFVLPLYLYTFIKYSESLKLRYLIFHVFTAGIMIQFQMAIGVPFLLLSFLFILYLIISRKRILHIFSFLLLLIPLSTFIIFDLRHEFTQLRSVLTSFSENSSISYTSFADRINNRWDNMTGNLYLVQGNYAIVINGVISLVLIFFLYGRVIQYIKKKRTNETRTILLLLYFYCGFYVISILFNGILLNHYTFPLIPLIFLLFCSAYLYINKKVFVLIFASIVVYNLYTGVNFIKTSVNAKGIAQTSWQFQSDVAQRIFSTQHQEIGYFIYTPDYYGYSPKYAYSYVKKTLPTKKIYLNQKMPITYLVVEPPPQNRPDIDPNFWKKEKMKIQSKPVSVFEYPNGFRIERYELNSKEIDDPIDPSVNDWIHFR